MNIKTIIFEVLRRVRLASRVTITLLKMTASGVRVQVSGASGETGGDAIEYFQHFGFRSFPGAGTQGIVLHFGPGHLVAIATEDKSLSITPLAEGSSGLYTSEGWAVKCHASGEVEVLSTNNQAIKITSGGDVEVVAGGDVNLSAPGGSVVVDAGEVKLEGAASATMVAKVGDQISVPGAQAGSSTLTGTITGPGAAKVKVL